MTRHGDWIEWEVCARAMPGERVSGDLEVAVACPDALLLAAIDGLGHGEAAAEAACSARDILLQSPCDPLDELVSRCHRSLHRSRGVALTVALVHRDGRAAWLGVGNVEAVVVRAAAEKGKGRESLLLQPGVVGQQIPRLRVSETRLNVSDRLVMATDGIRTAFLEALSGFDDAAATARRIFSGYAKQTDDAMVVAATYLRGIT